MDIVYEQNEIKSFLFQNDDYFKKYSKETITNTNYYSLKETFFSKENIDIIQKKLISDVKEKSSGKYIIGYQKNEHLIQIMDDIFKTYNNNVNEDINELNNKVVVFCLPYVFNQIDSYIKWQIDSNSPLIPLPLPETTSMAGKRSLPSTLLN
jgi:hypothetical protein